MKAFVDRAIRFIWLWFAIGSNGCGGIFVSAEGNNKEEQITFVNFSDKDIQISWVGPDQTRHPNILARPYMTVTTNTFAGHTFAYDWGGIEFLHAVARGGHDTQVHILGDRNVLNSNMRNTRQAEDDKILPRLENKHVVCGTTKGDLRITVKPFWSPRGAARFLELLSSGVRYFDGCALNRNVEKFLVQFGIGADYDQRTNYRSSDIPDDPQLEPPVKFRPGYMSYAGSGPNSRSTEIFIARPDTPVHQLGYFGTNPWETPFAYVAEEDLHVVTSWHAYGDMAPKYGNGPNPQIIYQEDGYKYLEKDFPELDYITGCVIVPDDEVKKDPLVTQQSYKKLAGRILVDEDEEEL